MKWLVQLNEVLDYLEENLIGEVDYDQAAALAGCSTFHFQRIFSYMAGVPLAEYLRRRRMTGAAFDLQNGAKVLDVALKYGYESPTSFNRAFQGVHGVPPSAAQKEGTALKAYPRISFSITIKGDVEMDYRLEKKEGFRIIGLKAPLAKEIEANFEAVPKLWQRAGESGALPKLFELMNGEPKGVLGISACMGDDEWAYYIGVASDLPLPNNTDDWEDYQVASCTWAIFPGQGPMPLAIQELEKRVITEWLPTSGYEYADAPDIEVYLNPDPANSQFEVWLPVKIVEKA